MIKLINRKIVAVLSLVIIFAGAVTSLWIPHISPPGPLRSQANTDSRPNNVKPVNKLLTHVAIEQQRSQLIKYFTVESALLGITDNLSLYYKDLNQDNEITINPERSWIPASTIKAYTAIEAFRQRRIGLIDFNQTITIKANNVVSTELETDEFPRLREGTQATIRQLVEAMVIQSDNTAYNTLLDILDRRSINQTLRDLGITETIVGEKLNLDDGQFQQDLQVPGRQPNTTTAKDLATLFNLLYTKQIADSDEILSIFKRQKINSMIPALLPPSTIIAHKTGDWAPIYHDGGIVYKPQQPFTLVIFTNSNDTNVLAQLAKVAYFQNAESVGQQSPGAQSFNSNHKNKIARIYLATNSNQAVLGATATKTAATMYIVLPGDTLWSISNKFYNNGFQWETIARRNYITDPANISAGMKLIIPYTTTSDSANSPKITAADLGITTKDLTTDATDVKNVQTAVILPGNIFYGIKRFLEDLALKTAQSNTDKIQAYLATVRHRLSELKTLSAKGDTSSLQKLFSDSEQALNNATNIAKQTDTPQLYLLQIQQLSQLHYAILAANMHAIQDPAQKEKAIDSIFQFYKSNQSEIQPSVKAFVAANPVQQEPTIGTVIKVTNTTATIKFDNGETKDVLLGPTTFTRDFHSQTDDPQTSLTVGSKVAIVGQTTPSGNIIPTFILRNIPKEVPNTVKGTVIEINPQKESMEIQDQKGRVDNVFINNTTLIHAKDTDVSLEGIKAGSQVSIVGEIKSIPTQAPQASSNRTATPQALPVPNNQGTELKATSITITKNSSGSQEKTVTASPPAKEQNNNANNNQPPSAQPPQQPEVNQGDKAKSK